MKLAILGLDETTLELGKAVLAEHEVAWICEFSEPVDPGRYAELLRSAKRLDHWEALLDPQFVDGVIVGRGVDQDARADQLRKLVQASVPLVVAHPVVDSMLVYYELEMIRQETHGVLVADLPLRHHPGVHKLREMIARAGAAEIGTTSQVVFERQLSDRSKRAVLAQFSRDVDVIRSLCGEINRVGAMAAAAADSYATLGVQMSGPGGILARWSLASVAGEGSGRISLVGERGTATLTLFDRGAQEITSSATLEIAGPQLTEQTFGPWKAPAETIRLFTQAVAGQQTTLEWNDAARAVELTETIDRSLAKGRTVELHFDDYSEEGTFKGIMASLGCGLLLAGLAVLLLVGVVDSLARGAGAQIPLLANWPILLLGLLAIFLIFQFTLLVARRRPASNQVEREDADAGKLRKH